MGEGTPGLSEGFVRLSDRFFDAPLLSAVAHPVAVNPDPRLHVLAVLRRWNVQHLDVPPGVVKVAGREIQEFLRPLLRPELIPYARFDIQGVENIPHQGPAILCSNHRSYFDFLTLLLVLARSGRGDLARAARTDRSLGHRTGLATRFTTPPRHEALEAASGSRPRRRRAHPPTRHRHLIGIQGLHEGA